MTAIVFGFFWISIATGIAVGAEGRLVDFFTRFRKLRGQLSGWALAIGGAIVGLEWAHHSRFGDSSTPSVWLRAIQYASVVLICWGVLMYVTPKLVSPNNRMERPREP